MTPCNAVFIQLKRLYSMITMQLFKFNLSTRVPIFHIRLIHFFPKRKKKQINFLDCQSCNEINSLLLQRQNLKIMNFMLFTKFITYEFTLSSIKNKI